MHGQGIATGDQHDTLAIVFAKDRGTEGFQGLDLSRGFAQLLPQVFACGGVHGQDVAGHVFARSAFRETLEFEGFVALKHLDVELAAVQHGAAAVGPLGGKGTVGFFEVALPLEIAFEIETGGDGIGKEEDDVLSVGDGRGAGEVAFVVPLKTTFGHHLAPEFLARFGIVAEADELLLVHDGGGEEDFVTPDHWDGGRNGRDIHGPFDAFGGAEFGGQVFLWAGTIHLRSTPVRPVFSLGKGGREGKGEEIGQFHAWSKEMKTT